MNHFGIHNAARIIERSMNKIDPRLMHHGKRVGYFLYRVLRNHSYTEAQLRDIALLGVLHDVGAFKTEELDKLVHFETEDVWGHSIYGYLFLKYFSPMHELAPVLLYHHANVAESATLTAEQQKLALLAHLCDRADLFYLAVGDLDGFAEYLESVRDEMFTGEVIDLFLSAKIDKAQWMQVNKDADFERVLYETPMGEEAALAFMRMVVYSVDFRSPQTLFHTFALTLVARKLAEILNMPEGEVKRIETAALLHDIGKMGTPLHILEATGKLSAEDFAIMRKHVEVSAEILTGCVDDEMLAMAVNHHERMDGKGYPNLLIMAERPIADRLMAVSDVLSALWGSRSYKNAFPKERVLGILAEMRGGHLDADLVDTAVAHYDELATAMADHARPVEALYDAMQKEWSLIKEAIAEGRFDLNKEMSLRHAQA